MSQLDRNVNDPTRARRNAQKARSGGVLLALKAADKSIALSTAGVAVARGDTTLAVGASGLTVNPAANGGLAVSSGLKVNADGKTIRLTPAGAVATRVDVGAALTLLTDAQRATYTAARGESVYATDTNLYYQGDGATAGGIAATLPFTAAQLVKLGILVPRHRNLAAMIVKAAETGLTADVPAAWHLGNSIAAENGPTAGSGFRYVAASALAAFTGVGTQTNWLAYNAGSGGTVISQPLAGLGDSADSTNSYAKRLGIFANSKAGYVLILSLRNDVSGVSLSLFTRQLRTCLLQCKRHNLDAIVCIDPCKIDPTTGAILDTAANWEPWAARARLLAAEHGASVIDYWAYFNLLATLGVSLLPFWTSDGVHPGNLGHRDMGNLLFALATTAPIAAAPAMNRPSLPGYTAAYTTWNKLGGGGTQNWGVAPLATPGTLGTSRQPQTGEATPQVFVVPGGSSIFFVCPGVANAVIVDWFTDPSNTGTATLGFAGIDFQTGISIGGSFSREGAQYYDLFGATNPLGINNGPGGGAPFLKVQAVGGQVSVCGVTWLGPLQLESHAVYANRVETGTWAAGTVAHSSTGYSETGRGSSTVGDTTVLTWFGTQLTAAIGTGPAAGKVTYSTDGGSSATTDAYNAGGTSANFINLASGLTEGWHSTTLTVATKNASSTGNQLSYAKVQAYTSNPDPSHCYIAVGSGETVNVPDFWRQASVWQVLSGTPVLAFAPGSGTITLTGGAAVVALSK